MSANAKFRWFLLALILVALFVVTSPIICEAKSWAKIEGFRSAKFGMEMREVKDAIHQDFGIPDRKITTITHPTERTKSLGITVDNLVPNAGKSRIVYVFGYRTQRLIQVNILMGHPVDTRVTPQRIVDAGNG